MFCPQCGQELQDAAKFCGRCGCRLNGSAPAKAPVPRKAASPGKTAVLSAIMEQDPARMFGIVRILRWMTVGISALDLLMLFLPFCKLGFSSSYGRSSFGSLTKVSFFQLCLLDESFSSMLLFFLIAVLPLGVCILLAVIQARSCRKKYTAMTVIICVLHQLLNLLIFAMVGLALSGSFSLTLVPGLWFTGSYVILIGSIVAHVMTVKAIHLSSRA